MLEKSDVMNKKNAIGVLVLAVLIIVIVLLTQKCEADEPINEQPQEHQEVALVEEIEAAVKEPIPFPNIDGKWHFYYGADSLFVEQKDSSTFNITWMSWTDMYVEHELTCKLEGSRLVADYYGATKNFVIEATADSVFLTIDPFHEFAPVLRQPFSRLETLITPKNFLTQEAPVTRTEKYLHTLLGTDKILSNKGSRAFIVDNESFGQLHLEKILGKFNEIKEYGGARLLFLLKTVEISEDYYSIIVEFEDDNVYYAYLINYNKEGELIDFEEVDSGDNVEGFTFIQSEYYQSFFKMYEHSMTDKYIGDSPIYDTRYMSTFSLSKEGKIEKVKELFE